MATSKSRQTGVKAGIADSLARAAATMAEIEAPREIEQDAPSLEGVTDPWVDRSEDRRRKKPWHTAT